MNDRPEERKYRNPLAFVEQGVTYARITKAVHGAGVVFILIVPGIQAGTG